ncbi:MAG: HAD family hydrolase [Magnetococcales bacterium]|nr:HAD family hydrolase [Magnetococcales bacterium]MBF0583141.1 HAD family hydrolase [Magnetococcales bacterium]
MALALFDLDNTLLAGDSDYLWGVFLVSQNIVDATDYERQNKKFFSDYQAGNLDIQAYLKFQLEILAQHDRETLYRWRARFVAERIVPIVAPQARALLQWHRQRGDTLVIITATNHFVTSPIAELLEVSHLLATELELEQGRFSGRPAGIPCFREGKVQRLTQWMADNQTTLAGSWFYSDSHNDLPLLTQVSHPVAVDPDQRLAQTAQQAGWEILSLRQSTLPARRV